MIRFPGLGVGLQERTRQAQKEIATEESAGDPVRALPVVVYLPVEVAVEWSRAADAAGWTVGRLVTYLAWAAARRSVGEEAVGL